MIKGFIYIITNKVNQKQYVGKTVRSLKLRFKQHCQDAKRGYKYALQKAIRKYGVDNFEIIKLEKIEAKNYLKLNTLLSNKEIYWISKLNTYGKGYNMTKGGDGLAGLIFSEEHKRKIALSRIGIPRTEETKEKLRIANLGKCHTYETKLKLRGNVSHFKGKHHSEITKQKISKAKIGCRAWNKGIKLSESHIMNMKKNHADVFGKNNSFYGKTHSLKSCDKISKNRRGKLLGSQNPAARRVVNIDTKMVFDTIRNAGKFYGIKSFCNISNVCANKLKRCGGYRWQYAN